MRFINGLIIFRPAMRPGIAKFCCAHSAWYSRITALDRPLSLQDSLLPANLPDRLAISANAIQIQICRLLCAIYKFTYFVT